MMKDNSSASLIVFLSKPVEIKLTHEREIVRVFEMFGKNIIGETSNIFNDKRFSVATPAHYILVGGVLNEFDSTSMMRYALARKSGILLRIYSFSLLAGFMLTQNYNKT